MWKELSVFDFGPRPESLYDTTSLKPIFKEFSDSYCYCEVSKSDPNIRHGKTICINKENGAVIESWFENDVIIGKGRKIKSDSVIYTGYLKEGLENGEGVYLWPNEDRYIG